MHKLPPFYRLNLKYLYRRRFQPPTEFESEGGVIAIDVMGNSFYYYLFYHKKRAFDLTLYEEPLIHHDPTIRWPRNTLVGKRG